MANRLSLKEKQKGALLRLINFNNELDGVGTDVGEEGEDWSDQWKLLIYDRFTRDVISPLLNVGELRKQGVTLHMLIDADREEISDVPAVYFIQPTEGNISRICKDAAAALYSSMYLNFASPLRRSSLELLARETVERECEGKITRVYDQYLNFICLEQNLFTLNQGDSYVAYNNPMARDTEIESLMEDICSGLFSVLSTLSSVPIIRCSRNGPGEMVARKLEQKIRETLSGRSDIFGSDLGVTGFQRPVLIILDRNDDLMTPLHHPSTYQAQVDDLLGISMNRVSVSSATTGRGGAGKKVYDLDTDTDVFFRDYAGALFPEAIEANEREMQQVTRKEEEIRTKAGGTTDMNAISEGTKDLVAAVDTLPALVEKKKQLAVHTNIFQAAFEMIASKQIPKYSVLEQKMMTGSAVDVSEVIEIMRDNTKDTFRDKLRLLLIYYLASGATTTDLERVEKVLREVYSTQEEEGQHGATLQAPPDFRALRYLRQHAAFRKKPQNVPSNTAADTSSTADPKVNSEDYKRVDWVPATVIWLVSYVPRPARRVVDRSSDPYGKMFKGLAGAFAGQATEWLQQASANVKSLILSNKKLPVTRITDNICELRPNTEDDTYLYLDPKVKATSSGTIPRQKTPYRSAIVFMIGGGNYAEYQNLKDYCKSLPESRRIVYGCTELLNSDRFLDQLSILGSAES